LSASYEMGDDAQNGGKKKQLTEAEEAALAEKLRRQKTDLELDEMG